MSEKPFVVVVMDGGIIQNVFIPQGRGMDIILVDHDTEGSPPEELIDGMFIATVGTEPHAHLCQEVREGIRKHCEQFQIPCPV